MLLLIVVVIAGLGVQNSLLKSAGRTAGEVPPIVRAALEAASTGAIIFPGGEGAFATASSTDRSGIAGLTPQLSAELDTLAGACRNRTASREDAVALIGGLVATGQVARAREYLEDAHGHFADDVRFVILDAVVAYADSDFSRAESILRFSLAAESTGPAMCVALFDLGVVVSGQNRLGEARRVFSEVQHRYPNSPVARRAGMRMDHILALSPVGHR